jgi:hypothetical protein
MLNVGDKSKAHFWFNSFACEYQLENCGSFVRAMRFAAAEPSV